MHSIFRFGIPSISFSLKPTFFRFSSKFLNPLASKNHSGCFGNPDLFLFPSSLEHMVIPFKSPVERVSVAGNIILADTENSSYQPHY